MTRSTLNFLPTAAETAADASTSPAEAAVCFTALESELKKLLPADCCGGGGCGCGGGAGCGGCRRSAAGEPEAGAGEPAEGGGGGGCCGSGRCRSVM